jgi:hypothetical protein
MFLFLSFWFIRTMIINELLHYIINKRKKNKRIRESARLKTISLII